MAIVAHIVVQGAERAVAFYTEAFGAQEASRIPVPDGRLMSVQLRVDGGLLHLADEFPEMGGAGPALHRRHCGRARAGGGRR